jgi:hypothetical protein
MYGGVGIRGGVRRRTGGAGKWVWGKENKRDEGEGSLYITLEVVAIKRLQVA